METLACAGAPSGSGLPESVETTSFRRDSRIEGARRIHLPARRRSLGTPEPTENRRLWVDLSAVSVHPGRVGSARQRSLLDGLRDFGGKCRMQKS